MDRNVIKATGMTCQHCVMRVTKGLKALNGVEEVAVDLSSGNITVDYDGAKVSKEQLDGAVKEAGYQVVS